MGTLFSSVCIHNSVQSHRYFRYKSVVVYRTRHQLMGLGEGGDRSGGVVVVVIVVVVAVVSMHSHDGNM